MARGREGRGGGKGREPGGRERGWRKDNKKALRNETKEEIGSLNHRLNDCFHHPVTLNGD